MLEQISPSSLNFLFLFFEVFPKGRVQKKKKRLEFSNRGGGGGSKIKKNPTFPKTVPFYLECHDSARNVSYSMIRDI